MLIAVLGTSFTSHRLPNVVYPTTCRRVLSDHREFSESL